MALTDFALRVAAVRALRGNTFVGNKVFDSEILPIDQKVQSQSAPFISVYTDASRTSSVAGRDILGAMREVDLSFDIAVSAQVEVDGIVIPKTDSALEAQLNVLGRQITRALVASDSPWGEIWRKLVVKIVRIEEERGAMAEVRFAARQVKVVCQVIAEPSFADPVGVWADLLVLLRADTDSSSLADILEAEMSTPTLADWQSAKADLGLTIEGWLGLGVTNVGGAPYVPQEGDEAALDASLDQTTSATQ